jgi:hypothetical protein
MNIDRKSFEKTTDSSHHDPRESDLDPDLIREDEVKVHEFHEQLEGDTAPLVLDFGTRLDESVA